MKEPKHSKADTFMESSDDILFRESDIFDEAYYELDGWQQSSVKRFRCLHAIHPSNSNPQWVGFMPSIDGTCVRVLTFQTRDKRENFKISIHFPEGANNIWRYLRSKRAFQEMSLTEGIDKINEILSVVGIPPFKASEVSIRRGIYPESVQSLFGNSANIIEEPIDGLLESDTFQTDLLMSTLEMSAAQSDRTGKEESELEFTLDDDLVSNSPGPVMNRLRDFLSQSPFGRMILDSELEGDK